MDDLGGKTPYFWFNTQMEVILTTTWGPILQSWRRLASKPLRASPAVTTSVDLSWEPWWFVTRELFGDGEVNLPHQITRK